MPRPENPARWLAIGIGAGMRNPPMAMGARTAIGAARVVREKRKQG